MKTVVVVNTLRREAIRTAAQIRPNSDVDCQFLGAPKPAQAKIVVLSSPEGRRQDNLLCACVAENVWVCHPGTFDDDGRICSNNPFNVRDLVVRDIVKEMFDEKTQPRVRLRPRPKVDLQKIAESNPSSWSAVRAFALWKAEEVKAESEPFGLE